MQTTKNQLILVKEDYEIMMSYLSGQTGSVAFDHHNIEELQTELKKAKLVSQSKFPADFVRLDSVVRIKDEIDNRILEVTLVTPGKADIKQKKISFMSPIGTALIGLQKGQQVEWNVPSGKKVFTILDVVNE